MPSRKSSDEQGDQSPPSIGGEPMTDAPSVPLPPPGDGPPEAGQSDQPASDTSSLSGQPTEPQQPPPEPIPTEQRVQTGVEPPREGEEVYQHGTEPAPAPQQDRSLETTPVKAEHFLEDTPPPGQNKAPLK